jgi:hypothetical protein
MTLDADITRNSSTFTVLDAGQIIDPVGAQNMAFSLTTVQL